MNKSNGDQSFIDEKGYIHIFSQKNGFNEPLKAI
jgi:hypothetical protein